MISGTEIALLALLGAVFALDQSGGLGLQLSQPLVAGALAGWVVGHFGAGVAGGALVQTIWIVTQPVGGARLPDLALAGVCAALAVPPDFVLNDWMHSDALAIAGVLGVATGYAGGALQQFQRRVHARLAAGVAARVQDGDASAVAALQHKAAWLHVVRGSTTVVFVALTAPRLASWLGEVGLGVDAGVTGVGLASVALARAARRRSVAVVAAAVVVGALVGVLG